MIPQWVFWGIVILWVIKDVVLFRYTWCAYDWEHQPPLIGTTGITVDRLAPSGYVRVGGELWRAEVAKGESPIEKGMMVRVRDVKGLALIVESYEE